MNRNEMLQRLNQTAVWDILIIGGGATGLGTALDAAARGYKTLLVEQSDFAKGTSSRSTKLLHGGVRYLAQGNIKLVREALKERAVILKNAPHVSNRLSFVIPCYSFWQKVYYGIGLKLYDLLAGKQGIGKTKITRRKKAEEYLPGLVTEKLSGAVVYTDGQFNDARLAINLAQTAVEKGATVINYCKAVKLLKQEGKICGLTVQDMFTGSEYEVTGKAVINATGVFADEVLQMDEAAAEKIVSPSQGIHLVVDKKFFPGQHALMIPETSDGRVLFALPWNDKILIGTTDTPVSNHSPEPWPMEQEIEFVIAHINKYLSKPISRTDVMSAFAGLRPLVKKGIEKKSSLMPRDHTILTSASGLITITGGKWTTYRKMAMDVLEKAVIVAGLEERPCETEALRIHGYMMKSMEENDTLALYGSDAVLIKNLCNKDEWLKERLHSRLPDIKAEVFWAVQNEMAQTVEDVLARRTGILFSDAQAAAEAAPLVARLMAEQMNKPDDWVQQQVDDFKALASQYLLSQKINL
jgi:glycerol-3-phosphate dehydrogenase